MKYHQAIRRFNLQKDIKSRFSDGKAKGYTWLTFCPFHDNTNTPALGIDLRSGVFGCFSCSARGNYFELVAHTLDSTPELVMKQLAGVEALVSDDLVSKRNPVQEAIDASRSRRDKIKVLDEKMLEQFPVGHSHVYKYLGGQRKLKRSIIDAFDCRWGGDGYWANRVIMPTRDAWGHLVSISGRSVLSDSGIDKMRHLKGGDQRNGLFGYAQAKALIAKCKKKIIVPVEGQIDTMTLVQCGIPSVAFGRMLGTESQLKQLVSLADVILIGVDDDVEAKNSTGLASMIEWLSDYAKVKRILPPAHDWNDALKLNIDIKAFFKGWL